MPDLNLDLDYFNHPKTLRLVGLLGRGADVLPIRLWAHCGKFHADGGQLTGYSAREIESILGWWGNEGDMVAAMVKVGFLDGENGKYVAHDFMAKQGHIAALKARGRELAEKRWAGIRNAGRNATRNAPTNHSNRTNQPYQPTSRTNRKEKSLRHDASRSEKGQDLVRRVIEEMKSPQSRPFYEKVLRELGPGILEECVGEVRYRAKTTHIANQAAYLTKLLQQRLDERAAAHK